MSNGNERPGLTKFALDDEDDIPVPTPQQRAAAREGGERLGFKSEPAEKPSKRELTSGRAAAMYTQNFHIRTTPEDRDRYDDFAHRYRMKKGEAMHLLLNLAEEAEAARAKKK